MVQQTYGVQSIVFVRLLVLLLSGSGSGNGNGIIAGSETRFFQLDRVLTKIDSFGWRQRQQQQQQPQPQPIVNYQLEKSENPVPNEIESSFDWQSDRTSISAIRQRSIKQPERDQSLVQLSQESQHRKSAMNLSIKIFRENECRLPQKRVLQVRQFYRKPDRDYAPSCLTLFRCSDETGCCHSNSFVCAPKTQETIKQHFFVTILGQNGNVLTEELEFVNHTSCECMEKDSVVMADAPVAVASTVSPRVCLCPKKFKSVRKSDGQCSCTCSKRNWACKKMSYGQEHFSLLDRLCISRNKCHEPNCKFGVYRAAIGRCPNETEQFDVDIDLSSFLHR